MSAGAGAWLDFSHIFAENVILGAKLPEPSLIPLEFPSSQPGGRILATEMCIATHVGTHIDAPLHFVPGGARIADMPLEAFAGRAVISEVEKDPGATIEVADILEGGPQPKAGDILIVKTGWWRHYAAGDRDAYLHAPIFSPEAADWCVAQNLKMLAADTLSPDPAPEYRSPDYPMTVHWTLLSAGVLIAENLNLERAAAGHYEVCAFPISTSVGDGGPVRFTARTVNP